MLKDGVDGDGGLGEPVGEGLLFGGEGAEAFGFDLDEGGFADAVDDWGGGEGGDGGEKGG